MVSGLLARENGVPALAWLDLEGRAVGARTYGTPPPERAGGDLVSTRPVGLSAQGAAAFDQELVIIDPVNRQPEVVELPAPAGFPRPVWSREALVVATATGAVVYPAGDLTRPMIWAGYEGSSVEQLILSPPGDAYALVSRPTREGYARDLLRIDLASARTIDRLPLALGEPTGGGAPRILPLGEGRLLAFTHTGHAALLAPSAPEMRPLVEVDNLYPAAGEDLQLVAQVDREIRELVVAWGDGVLDTASPGAPATHAYDAPGRRVVRVVAVYPDNRTGTAQTILFVGGTPPQELNAMQRAFAPENQEITFFLLGIAATAVGGGIAFARRTKRKSRLHADLVELDRLREVGRLDPFDAVRRLALFRGRIKGDLANGALDDAQYAALSSEAMRLLGTLRLRLIGGLEGRPSPSFQHMLETALEDGQVSAEEQRALVAALGREPALTEGDRARLGSLIASWRI